ncbi:MAG: ribonuclease HIII [Erysipelotrichaceae bacterium]|nr:ribonuclease HIII [Erysipelotrichaceae bacterium]
MKNHSFKADKETYEKILKYFDKSLISAGDDILKWKIRDDGVSINMYNSGSVVISGEKADDYWHMFIGQKKQTLPQAGSDEVGTGDFFGPICVCASYVDENTYASLSDLNLTDSKQLTDVYIREIAPRLIDSVPHSLLVLDDSRYNQVINENNMNAIKAKMHNKAYYNLWNKGITLPELCVVDDFSGETLYYRYIKDEIWKYDKLTFHTKAESQFVSVAIGSIISRYAFLKYMDALSERYQTVFPKGAGAPVDEFALEFRNIHGLDEFKKVAKCNFKNYKKLL